MRSKHVYLPKMQWNDTDEHRAMLESALSQVQLSIELRTLRGRLNDVLSGLPLSRENWGGEGQAV
ncbi:hypothetical protein D3C81_1929970 [compost metagenome]